MNDSAATAELMMLTSQIYVRLRRCNGRIVDALYMARNEAYAREILALAVMQPDPELQVLASRFERWLDALHPLEQPLPATGAVTPPEASLPPIPVMSRVDKPEHLPVTEAAEPTVIGEEVAQHYIGALR